MSTSAALKIAAASDPKKALREAVSPAIKKMELLHNKILVAIYIAPEKTASGLYRTNNNIKEDVWQGMVGLVMKKGPIAFVDDEHNKFGGVDMKEGEDWVAFTPGDGRRIQINGVDCRIIEDTQIMMRVSDPEIVTHYK